MTFQYKNVYLGPTSTVAGPYEKNGPLGKYYDKTYDELYCGEKTFEEAEIKLLLDSVNLVKEKGDYKIDLHIGGDLLNQIVASNYLAAKLKKPYLGIYNACALSTESLIIGSNMIDKKQIGSCLCTTSSHNNGAERQFRYPVEYGGEKPITLTFTTTGGTSAILTSEKTDIKVESATIGIVADYGIKDVYHMGAVMAPAAADTIYRHLTDLNRDVSYYDLILTGDLGKYGKDILKDFMKKEYKMDLKNHEDSACMIFDLDKQPVYAGGSGPACLPLVTYSYIIKQMREGKLSKVLLVATGALMNTTMVNLKKTIPSIAHAVSLEVVK